MNERDCPSPNIKIVGQGGRSDEVFSTYGDFCGTLNENLLQIISVQGAGLAFKDPRYGWRCRWGDNKLWSDLRLCCVAVAGDGDGMKVEPQAEGKQGS
jgi:hypothetical protein